VTKLQTSTSAERLTFPQPAWSVFQPPPGAAANVALPNAPDHTPDHLAARTEWLPFTVESVDSAEGLYAAIQIRQSAYARHLPAFAAQLAEPEAADLDPGSVLLLGTMRIQTNLQQPLALEQSLLLPSRLRDAHLAEATRLGVTQAGVGRLVKTALFKAFYLYCVGRQVEHMVVTARPPIDRQYERLLFSEVFPGRGAIPIRHVGNLPHRVLSFELAAAQQRWAETRHPLLDFMCHTQHPDIRLPAALPRRLRPQRVDA
jgi:hypothetical protein